MEFSFLLSVSNGSYIAKTHIIVHTATTVVLPCLRQAIFPAPRNGITHFPPKGARFKAPVMLPKRAARFDPLGKEEVHPPPEAGALGKQTSWAIRATSRWPSPDQGCPPA